MIQALLPGVVFNALHSRSPVKPTEKPWSIAPYQGVAPTTTKIEKISARYPRWVTGPRDKIEKAANESGRMLLFDSKGMPIILFKDEWSLRWALKNDNDSGITFHEIAP